MISLEHAEPHQFVPGQLVKIDGFIHLVLDSEHVLCHTATSDAADSEGDEALRWLATTATAVTCPQCASIIRLCRNHDI